jgi:hypothetical protein
LTWSVIAPSLGLPQTNPVFPVRTVCPFCEGDMSIYKDNKNGEEWAYCSSCQQSSSVFQLASQVWDVPLQAAVNRLADMHNTSVTSAELDSHIKKCVETHKKADKLWQKSRKNLLKNRVGLSRLRNKLGLHFNQLSFQRISQGPAALFGVSNVKEIRDLWGGRTSYQKAEFFKGKNWGDVLVIPYFKAPGNVASILFVGREGKKSTDQVFQTYARRTGKSSNASLGFAGLHAVSDHESDHVVLSSNVLNVLRIQMRHFVTNLKPLPFVSWRNDPQNVLVCNWQLFNGRRIIFWEPVPSASLLYQCRSSDADLVLNVGPKSAQHENMSHWVRNQKSTLDIDRVLQAEAKPWKAAVRSWSRLPTTTEGKISLLLEECSQLDNALFEDVRSAIGWQKTKSLHFTQTISVDGRTYSNRAGVWYTNKTEKPLFDGNIYVTDIIVRKNKRPEYVGKINLKESSFTFRVSGKNKAALNRALWDLVESSGYFCERKAPGGVSLIHLAMQFRQPKVWEGADKVGWNGQGFQLQNCNIFNGTYEKTPTALFEETLLVPYLKQYNWDSSLSTTLIANQTLEAQWAWSIVLSFLNQILAPMAKMPVPRLVFTHDDYHDAAFHRILWLLGVPVTSSHWPHNWPTVSSNKPARSQVFKCTIETPPLRSKSRRGTYQVICPCAEIMHPKNIPNAFKCVIPDFLRWLTSKNCDDIFDETPWPMQVLKLFARWAEYRNLSPIFKDLASAAKNIKTR